MEIKKLEKEKYPYLLKQTTGLPERMDIIGSLPSDDNKFLCIIGSRTHSTYGAEACEQLIAGLKGYPIVIVSGMAIGIDSLVHETALKYGITTISFPGSGLSPHVLYPPSHTKLARRIVDSGGALISRFPVYQPGDYWTFPARNRLMAGVSQATLIIEGRRGSGTLGTAEYVIEFNRDLMIVPGSIFSDLSYGPHLLYKQGATPVTSSLDILRVLGFDVGPDKDRVSMSQDRLNSFEPLPRQIIESVTNGIVLKDEIARALDVPIHELNAHLSMLE